MLQEKVANAIIILRLVFERLITVIKASLEPTILLALILTWQTAASVDSQRTELFALFGSSLCLWFVLIGFSDKQGVKRVISLCLRALLAIAISLCSYTLVLHTQPSARAIALLSRFKGDTFDTSDTSEKIFLDISGTILQPIERKRVGELRLSVMSSELNGKVLLSAPDLPWLSLSGAQSRDIVRLNVRIRAVKKPNETKPSVFSYQGYLFRRGYVAYGSVEKVYHLEQVETRSNRREEFLISLIRQFGSRDALDIILAVTLGEKGLVGDKTKKLFQHTGTSHLLVVSGFHVGVVYCFIYALTRWLLLRASVLLLWVRAEVPASLCGLLWACCYAMLVGGAPTTIRALCAVAVIVVGLVLGRRNNAQRTLALAFVIVVLIWPGVFLEVGCQLTFSALIGLLIGNKILRMLDIERSGSRARAYVLKAFMYSFCAWYCTTPVLLLWFNTLVPLGSIINALVVPVFCAACIVVGGCAVAMSFLGVYYCEDFMSIALVLVDSFVYVLSSLELVLQLLGIGFIELSPRGSVVLAGVFGLGFVWFVIYYTLFRNLINRASAKNGILMSRNAFPPPVTRL